MSDSPEPKEGELILYQTPAGAVRIEVLYQTETFWLNQKQIAELFGVDLRTVSYHLSEIYGSGELSQEATLQKIWRVQTEGSRQVRREIEFYNLDAIISDRTGRSKAISIARSGGSSGSGRSLMTTAVILLDHHIEACGALRLFIHPRIPSAPEQKPGRLTGRMSAASHHIVHFSLTSRPIGSTDK